MFPGPVRGCGNVVMVPRTPCDDDVPQLLGKKFAVHGEFALKLKPRKTTLRAGMVPNPEFMPRNTTRILFEFWRFEMFPGQKARTLCPGPVEHGQQKISQIEDLNSPFPHNFRRHDENRGSGIRNPEAFQVCFAIPQYKREQ